MCPEDVGVGAVGGASGISADMLSRAMALAGGARTGAAGSTSATSSSSSMRGDASRVAADADPVTVARAKVCCLYCILYGFRHVMS